MFEYIILPFIIGLIIRVSLCKIPKVYFVTIFFTVITILLLICSMVLNNELFGVLLVISLSVSVGSALVEFVVKILKRQNH